MDPDTVDKARVGFLGFIACLLPLVYGHAIFCKHSRFAADLALANPAQTAELVWAQTPPTVKYVAIQAGGFAVCMCIIIGGMLAFQPGCEQALCKSVALVMVYWQLVWYGGMLGRIDAADEYKRDCMAYFKKETIQEIVLGSIFAYLGFIAIGSEDDADKKHDYATIDKVRMGFLVFVCCLLPSLYGHAIFFKQSKLAGGDLSLADPNDNPEEVWAKTPATTKYVALQAGGWATCMCIVMAGALGFAPECNKALCKCFSLTMVWWQLVWYGGMLGRIDAEGTYDPIDAQSSTSAFKRDWMAYFKKETIQEIVLGSVFGYLGFIAN